MSRFLISSFAAAMTLGSVTPAFAYVYENLPRSVETDAIMMDATDASNYDYRYQGSIVRHDRGITSRVVSRRAERLNRPDVGYIRRRGGDRTIAEDDQTGRTMLPVRADFRAEYLRNANRHLLGVGTRDGDWRILRHQDQGDTRRRPIGWQGGLPNYRYDMSEEEFMELLESMDEGAMLPPSLVQTGGSTGVWLYDRPTRRDVRENLHYTEVNDRDRALLDEMSTKVRE